MMTPNTAVRDHLHLSTLQVICLATRDRMRIKVFLLTILSEKVKRNSFTFEEQSF